MFKKKCRCGKSEKNFKFDIGPFFVADCCLDAGYDELGRKPGEEESDGLEDEKELVEEIQEALEPLPEEVQEEVVEDMIDQVEEDLESLEKEDLKKLCDEKGIKYAKNISKKKLIEKLVKAE